MFLGLPWTEWLGYLASLVVAISLLMKSLLRLRWINTAGSLIFSIYGFLIGAYPVGGFNAVIVLINAYFLFRIYRTQETFELLEVRPDDIYLPRFLQFHQADIARFFPTFDASRHVHPYEDAALAPAAVVAPSTAVAQAAAPAPAADPAKVPTPAPEATPASASTTGDRNMIGFYILRDMTIAGLFLGNLDKDGMLDIELDYVVPAYRDYKSGRFLFGACRKRLALLGVRHLRAGSSTKEHDAYLQRMGFTLQGDVYTMPLFKHELT